MPHRVHSSHSFHPFSHPLRAESERLAIQEAERLEAFLESLPYESAEKNYLLKLVRTRKYIPYEKANHSLVVMGKTGQGKTSTIYSIIGVDLGNAVSCY